MYKCLECGNTEKFYGIAKERGNALIFQNCGEFKGCDGSNVLEEALDVLRKGHDRQKQVVGVSENYPNAVCINTGHGQISDPDSLSKISGHEDVLESIDDPVAPDADPGEVIRGNLWSIQNDDKGGQVNWAYITSDKSWKGFHEVRSCAACKSTNIVNI
jgi:hypothetical protein